MSTSRTSTAEATPTARATLLKSLTSRATTEVTTTALPPLRQPPRERQLRVVRVRPAVRTRRPAGRAGLKAKTRKKGRALWLVFGILASRCPHWSERDAGLSYLRGSS